MAVTGLLLAAGGWYLRASGSGERPVARPTPPPTTLGRPHHQRHRPARTDPTDVDAAMRPKLLRGAARHALPRVYLPKSLSDTVSVIDPRRRRVVSTFRVGAMPEHVTPSYDLWTLYVLNDAGNTPIDPRTATPRRPIHVDDPYNLYFTPTGNRAIVVAERLHRLDLRDQHTFRLGHALIVPCTGVDHMDFSADGRYPIASCEFSGQLLKLDVGRERVVGTLRLKAGGMPQDVKVSPDGKLFYVADMMAGGLGGGRPPVPGRRASCAPAAVSTASTRAETRSCSTPRTAARDRSR